MTAFPSSLGLLGLGALVSLWNRSGMVNIGTRVGSLAPWEPARHAPYYTSPAGDIHKPAPGRPRIPSKGTGLSYGLLRERAAE